MKIGILGLGQAGGKIAQTLYNIAPDLYSPLAINLANQDLASLPLPESRKLHIKWKREGAGRDPEVPYESLSDQSIQQTFLQKISDVFGANLENKEDFQFKVDFLLIALGAGGGTGNGFLSALIDGNLLPFLPPIGVILATPRQIDSYQEQQNTAVLIQKINDSLQNQTIRTVFLMNNDKYSTVYLQSPQIQARDWMAESNRHFSLTLTNFFNQTKKPSEKSLDEADLTNMLTKFHGYSAILFKKGEPSKVLDSAVTSLENDGYSIRAATAIATMLVGRKSERHENQLLSQIRELIPNVSQYIYTGFYEADIDENENHIMLSGMDTPDYIAKMIEGLKTFLSQTQSTTRLQTPDLSFLAQQPPAQKKFKEGESMGKFQGFNFQKKK